MNVWFRRLLLILTIGGGFIGIALTVQFFAQADKVIAYAMLLAFLGLYGYGIFVGLKLTEGPPPLKYLRLYFGLQIPFISSPIVAYQFCSGLQLTVAIMQSNIRWGCRLGADGQFAIMSSAPWGIGINFVALAILVLLYSRLAAAPEEPQRNSAASEIELS
jgi:hypothetical protein